MDKSKIEALQTEFADKGPQEILEWALGEFGSSSIGLASSFSIEDQVITDMLLKLDKNAQIFTLDTGRLHQSSYDVIELNRRKYDISIEMLFPDSQHVEKMLRENGPNLFFESLEKRKLCCSIRKVEPLKEKLSTLKAWITGLRREQSEARSDIKVIEWDENFNLLKINPLFDWEEVDVWDYIRANRVPYNKLYDCGYASIGCAPCSRPIRKGDDARSGRWWWESTEKKECGLHLKDGKSGRKEQ